MQLFPFTLVFRPDLKIIAVGRQLKQMFPDNILVGQALPDVARVRRPKLLFTWGNVTYFYFHTFKFLTVLFSVLLHFFF